MAILAYLLRTSFEWRNASVTLKMVMPNESAAVSACRNIEAIVERTRTGAKTEVIVSDGRSFEEILQGSSSGADLVMLGLAEPRDDFVAYYERVQSWIADLPPTLLVLAAEDLAFGEVLLERES